jgi:hypothetical protein
MGVTERIDANGKAFIPLYEYEVSDAVNELIDRGEHIDTTVVVPPERHVDVDQYGNAFPKEGVGDG